MNRLATWALVVVLVGTQAFVVRVATAAASYPSGWMDQPAAGSTVTGNAIVGGWALDEGAATGTGVDRVQVYLDGVYRGDAAYSRDRPDIGAAYGARFAPSGYGYVLDMTGAAPGSHTIEVRARSMVTGLEAIYSRSVNVTAGPAPAPTAVLVPTPAMPEPTATATVAATAAPTQVATAAAGYPSGWMDQPAAGSTVTGNAIVSGWALDEGAATGTGVDRVQVYLDGVYWGDAAYSRDRPDIGAAYGTRFVPSGYRHALDLAGVASGSHTIEARARSAVTGLEAVYSRSVNVIAGPIATATVAATAALTQMPTAQPTTGAVSGSKLFGTSIAGGEFGSAFPGVMGVDYLYAADASRHTYLAGKGLTLIRVPFSWERVQHQSLGPLSAPDVQGIRAMLDAAAAAGQRVILDMHNYARYYDRPLLRSDAANLADVWTKLATEFNGHPGLFGYELMNEPHDLPEGSDAWAYLAQQATDAVRKADRVSWVLVPGYSWQTARFWPEKNASLNVSDPVGRVLYAAHQYFDADYTGTYSISYDAGQTTPNIGVDRVRPFLDWLQARNARGILTEYGVPDSDPRWLTVLENFLATLDSNPRIAGGTYWSAGAWWGTYPLSIEPGPADRPQMAVLARHPSRP